jgi:hypothetical protein
MENVGNAENLDRFEDGPAEEAEAFSVVTVTVAVVSIKTLAIKQFRAVYEVELHPIAFAAVDNSYETVAVRKRDGDGSDCVFWLASEMRSNCSI